MESITINATPDGRLSRKAASAYLGISVKTLANWAYRGIGPRSIKVGGLRFYYIQEINNFIASNIGLRQAG